MGGIKVNLDSLLSKVAEAQQQNYDDCMSHSPPEYRQYCRKHGPGLKTMEGDYNVQLDVAGERLKIEANARAEYDDSDVVPPPLRGQTASGKGSLAFDAAAGFVVVKEKGEVHSQVGPFDYEYCARVHFPQGLLPPGQMIMAKLDEKKQKVTDALNQAPHTEATVDGNSVAVYSLPARGSAPAQFGAIMHDATPVGYGINTAPSGTWEDATIKFNGWTIGAGTIADEPCVEMSATELLQNHHAIRSLWAFDQVMDLMNKQEPLKSVLAFVPVQPSKIFESAAKLENLEVSRTRFNENAKVDISPASSWATVAMAAVGGVVGASLVLVLSKTRTSPRVPELLG